MDTNALFKIGYGLYVLTTNYDNEDNGCIVNTVIQISDSPLRISVTVNKLNHTHDMILDSCVFNVSCLTKDTPFEIFERFGFHSGKDVNKFKGLDNVERTANNVLCVPQYSNAVISCHVVKTIDFGTHTMFIADVTDSKVLSDVESVTYQCYQDNIKPKPEKIKGKGWRCKICGWVYEGEELPDDIICPICKHGAIDFVPVE